LALWTELLLELCFKLPPLLSLEALRDPALAKDLWRPRFAESLEPLRLEEVLTRLYFETTLGDIAISLFFFDAGNIGL
jgi:hypothetical protein